MIYENFVIDPFMKAWFNKDYSGMSEDDFDTVYSEYQDTSGLYLTEDFERRSYIHHLNSRINYIKIYIRLQRDFIEEFGKPFIRDFGDLKEKYGYVLTWSEEHPHLIAVERKKFEMQLRRIEMHEKKFDSTLQTKIKELNESREGKIKNPEDFDLRKSRVSFIKMLNSLSKIGYSVDRRKTTVEELALMIKQQMEEVEEQNKVLMNR